MYLHEVAELGAVHICQAEDPNETNNIVTVMH